MQSLLSDQSSGTTATTAPAFHHPAHSTVVPGGGDTTTGSSVSSASQELMDDAHAKMDGALRSLEATFRSNLEGAFSMLKDRFLGKQVPISCHLTLPSR